MNGTHFIFAVTLFGATFVVICLYFDKHRHKDPYFRKKLKLRRDRSRLLKEEADRIEKSKLKICLDIKNTKDHEAVILHEIQLAEGLMVLREYEQAIMHFANAIVICVDPCNLLIALSKTLPPEAFELLIQILFSTYESEFAKFKYDIRLRPVLESHALLHY